MTKKEKQILQDFLALIRCSVGTRDDENEDNIDAVEVALFNQLAERCGVRKI